MVVSIGDQPVAVRRVDVRRNPVIEISLNLCRFGLGTYSVQLRCPIPGVWFAASVGWCAAEWRGYPGRWRGGEVEKYGGARWKVGRGAAWAWMSGGEVRRRAGEAMWAIHGEVGEPGVEVVGFRNFL